MEIPHLPRETRHFLRKMWDLHREIFKYGICDTAPLKLAFSESINIFLKLTWRLSGSRCGAVGFLFSRYGEC